MYSGCQGGKWRRQRLKIHKKKAWHAFAFYRRGKAKRSILERPQLCQGSFTSYPGPNMTVAP